MRTALLLLCVLWAVVAIVSVVAVLAYADTDFIDQTSQVYTDLKAMRDGCGQTVSGPDGTDWCVGANGHNLYQWNYDTHTLEQVCDGVLNNLSWLPSVGIAAQSTTDPDLAVWWTPMGNGRCRAVRVRVE